MSDSTNDTSALDEKKNARSPDDINLENWGKSVSSFLTSLIAVILVIFLYFANSGLVLFLCKLAQSNILPTDDCPPYSIPTIRPTPIHTNLFTQDDVSLKFTFDYNDGENNTNKLLDTLRDQIYSPKANFYFNYFWSVWSQVLRANYSAINATMNSLNQLPESLVMALGPLLLLVIAQVAPLLNFLYCLFNAGASNLDWFFKMNTKDENGKTYWPYVSWFSPFLFLRLLILFFSILPIFVFFALISAFSMAYCLLTCLFYKGEINGKEATLFTVIGKTFKYYKVAIVSLISIFAVLLALSNMGVIAAAFCAVVLGLVYKDYINIGLFTPADISAFTAVTSVKQAVKTCAGSGNQASSKKKHGVLYNLLFGQKGGRPLVKDLKKVRAYM